jgi:hypothetical protein
MALLALPIVFLNFFGAIIAVSWLLIEGQWQIALFAVLALAAAPMGLRLTLLPAAGLGFLGAAAIEKRWAWAVVLTSFISNVWTYSVIFAWVLLVFLAVVLSSVPASLWWPYLLLLFACIRPVDLFRLARSWNCRHNRFIRNLRVRLSSLDFTRYQQRRHPGVAHTSSIGGPSVHWVDSSDSHDIVVI